MLETVKQIIEHYSKTWKKISKLGWYKRKSKFVNMLFVKK